MLVPICKDSMGRKLVACVKAAACNTEPPCSRGPPRRGQPCHTVPMRNMGRSCNRERVCSMDPTRGKVPTRGRALNFAEAQRATIPAFSTGKVYSAGRTHQEAWS